MPVPKVFVLERVDYIDGNTPARKLAVCVLVVYTPIKQRVKQGGNGEPQKK